MAKYNFRNLHEVQGAAGNRCSADRVVYRSTGQRITVSFHKDVCKFLGFQKGDYVVIAFDKEQAVFAVRKKNSRDVGGYTLSVSGSRMMVTFRAIGIFPSVTKPVRLEEVEQDETMIVFKMPGGIIAR